MSSATVPFTPVLVVALVAAVVPIMLGIRITSGEPGRQGSCFDGLKLHRQKLQDADFDILKNGEHQFDPTEGGASDDEFAFLMETASRELACAPQPP